MKFGYWELMELEETGDIRKKYINEYFKRLKRRLAKNKIKLDLEFVPEFIENGPPLYAVLTIIEILTDDTLKAFKETNYIKNKRINILLLLDVTTQAYEVTFLDNAHEFDVIELSKLGTGRTFAFSILFDILVMLDASFEFIEFKPIEEESTKRFKAVFDGEKEYGIYSTYRKEQLDKLAIDNLNSYDEESRKLLKSNPKFRELMESNPRIRELMEGNED